MLDETTTCGSTARTAREALVAPVATLDRPADRLLTDRCEVLTGWVAAPEGGELRLRLRSADRELLVRPCRHPTAPPGARGFWTMLFVQEHLDAVRGGSLALEAEWEGRACGRFDLRVTPIARFLATAYPLDLRNYSVPLPVPVPVPVPSAVPPSEAPPSAAPDAPRAATGLRPVVEFPGLGGVGGASLNQLVRLALLREGGDLPVFSEADDPVLWRRIASCEAPPYRWIDGHRCFGAAARLGQPFRRLILLRDPLRRLVSIHDYNALVHPELHPFASVDEFVASGAARRASQAYGLVRLAGGDPERLSDRELHAEAAALLARPDSLIGVTECFEETVFVVARALGLASIGMWWRVLSAPRSVPVEELPAQTRLAAERALAADLRLYDDARRLFRERSADLAAHPVVRDYFRDSGARRELPDAWKAVECLRWRQRITEGGAAAHGPPSAVSEVAR